MRRRKAWLFGWSTCALAGLSLLLLVDEISLYWLIGSVGLTAISGIAALVFRFIEPPREVTVRRFPGWPPVIHLKR